MPVEEIAWLPQERGSIMNLPPLCQGSAPNSTSSINMSKLHSELKMLFPIFIILEHLNTTIFFGNFFMLMILFFPLQFTDSERKGRINNSNFSTQLNQNYWADYTESFFFFSEDMINHKEQELSQLQLSSPSLQDDWCCHTYQ